MALLGEIKILWFGVEKWRIVNLRLGNSYVRQKLARLVELKCSEKCASTTLVWMSVCAILKIIVCNELLFNMPRPANCLSVLKCVNVCVYVFTFDIHMYEL